MSSQERYLSMTSFHLIHFLVSSARQSFYPPFFLISSTSIFLASFWIISVCRFSYCRPAVSHGNSLRLVSFYLFYQPYPVICLPLNSSCNWTLSTCLCNIALLAWLFPFWACSASLHVSSASLLLNSLVDWQGKKLLLAECRKAQHLYCSRATEQEEQERPRTAFLTNHSPSCLHSVHEILKHHRYQGILHPPLQWWHWFQSSMSTR